MLCSVLFYAGHTLHDNAFDSSPSVRVYRGEYTVGVVVSVGLGCSFGVLVAGGMCPARWAACEDVDFSLGQQLGCQILVSLYFGGSRP